VRCSVSFTVCASHCLCMRGLFVYAVAYADDDDGWEKEEALYHTPREKERKNEGNFHS
jgi:hypothetical protein